MGKTVTIITCPQCKQLCRVYADDRITRHKTGYYLPFLNRKEWCAFSKGTWADARAGISPHMRRMESHIKRIAKYHNRPLTDEEIKKLSDWGIM